MQYLCQLSLWTRLSFVLQALNRRAEIAERGLERKKVLPYHARFAHLISCFRTRRELVYRPWKLSQIILACENNSNSDNNKEAKKGGCFCRLRLSRSLLDTNRICRSPVWPRLLFSRKNVWNICQCTLVVELAELPFTLRTLEPWTLDIFLYTLLSTTKK